MKQLYERYKVILLEVFRYLLVGGLATIIDWGLYAICYQFIFPQDQLIFGINWGLSASTTIGFIGGLIFNYLLSIYFVFTNTKDKNSGKSVKDFTVFAIIGVVGLFIKLIGMQVFVENLRIYHLIAQVIMTIIVLAWNYIGRKVLIFK
jgi:putative flippase GtrA